MQTTFQVKRFLHALGKGAIALVLAASLVLSQAHSALAASGGRSGGFRSPSRSGGYSAPSRSGGYSGGGYSGGGYSGGGYYGGGGFGFPFMIPFMFGGGGSLLSLLVFMAIAGFLLQTFRNVTAGSGSSTRTTTDYSTVTIGKLQVGLLAQARTLQKDLDRIAQTADTSTNEGLAGMLQETVLAILRHPEYWVYGATDTKKATLTSAETEFNRMTLIERSKIDSETLSNYNGQLRSSSDTKQLNGAGGELAKNAQGPGEYIIVTLIVAAQSQLQLPRIDNADHLRQALRQLGSISGDQLLGTELLWTPQLEGDVLSSEEVLTAYPELRAVG